MIHSRACYPPAQQHQAFFLAFAFDPVLVFRALLPCGRELPYELLKILPRLVRLSPLPMVLLRVWNYLKEYVKEGGFYSAAPGSPKPMLRRRYVCGAATVIWTDP